MLTLVNPSKPYIVIYSIQSMDTTVQEENDARRKADDFRKIEVCKKEISKFEKIREDPTTGNWDKRDAQRMIHENEKVIEVLTKEWNGFWD